MTRLLDAVRRGSVSRVIVLKLDRLTRSVRDLAELIDLFSRHDVALISVGEALDTGSAAGRMVVNMLGAVAQWEREAIGERTATALEHKRRGRQVYGHIPFGYRRTGDRLVVDPGEQYVVDEMRALSDLGCSLSSIARLLNSRGITPHRGKQWDHSSVRAVLRSRIASESEIVA